MFIAIYIYETKEEKESESEREREGADDRSDEHSEQRQRLLIPSLTQAFNRLIKKTVTAAPPPPQYC